jgi:hypothetical protein
VKRAILIAALLAALAPATVEAHTRSTGPRAIASPTIYYNPTIYYCLAGHTLRHRHHCPPIVFIPYIP